MKEHSAKFDVPTMHFANLAECRIPSIRGNIMIRGKWVVNRL